MDSIQGQIDIFNRLSPYDLLDEMLKVISYALDQKPYPSLPSCMRALLAIEEGVKRAKEII